MQGRQRALRLAARLIAVQTGRPRPVGGVPDISTSRCPKVIELRHHAAALRREAELQKKRGGWRTLSPRHRAGRRSGQNVRLAIEPERLVFIDETWTKTNMGPLRG
jgi:hypothetical protein